MENTYDAPAVPVFCRRAPPGSHTGQSLGTEIELETYTGRSAHLMKSATQYATWRSLGYAACCVAWHHDLRRYVEWLLFCCCPFLSISMKPGMDDFVRPEHHPALWSSEARD